MKKKMNIRGSIRMLEIGETMTIRRGEALPSYVRAICSTLRQDYGMEMTVQAKFGKDIIVTRNA